MREWKYLDVHAHMIHQRFVSDIDEVIKECQKNQVAVICNGTDHSSNQGAMELSIKYPDTVYAAMGIYPVEALYNMEEPLEGLTYQPEKFDLEAEINLIHQAASEGRVVAIGEIGMDAHSLSESSYEKQEQIFRRLATIGIEYDLPLIVHSRRMESKTLSVLEELKAKRVVMHCYCGNITEATSYAEKYNWMFSLPVTTPSHSKLSVLCKRLDINNILLETDSPYLNIDRGVRNTPVNIIKTLSYIAQVKQLDLKSCQDILLSNIKRMFSKIKED